MKKNVHCHELIQNTDFVPTWFSLAGVRPPEKYKMDGINIAPLFANPNKSVREYVYGEIGAARSIKTKDWNYISLRYTRNQIDSVRSNERRIMKKLQGLSGGISRGMKNPNAFNYDQLYNLSKDPKEQNNLAQHPECKNVLDKMKKLLRTELKRFPDRPYGEFIPGGNASPIGTFDDILDKMAKAAKQSTKKPKRPTRRKK